MIHVNSASNQMLSLCDLALTIPGANGRSHSSGTWGSHPRFTSLPRSNLSTHYPPHREKLDKWKDMQKGKRWNWPTEAPSNHFSHLILLVRRLAGAVFEEPACVRTVHTCTDCYARNIYRSDIPCKRHTKSTPCEFLWQV